MGMARGLVLLIACATAGTAAAQERRPLLGRVVDEQGAPVASAAVTIVENDAQLVGLDPVDVIEATTDEAGRFVAAALRGVPYSAFAVGPEHDGEALLARPVSGLGCGRSIELRVGMIGKRKQARVDGLAAFGDIALLRARLVFPACPGYAVELPLGSDGAVELPPVATMVNVRIDRVEGGTLGLFDALGDDASVSLHTFAIAVCAVDAAGAPVAGVRTVATFQHVFDGTPALESPAAMTDADGRATLHVPAWVDPFVEAPQGLFVLGTRDGYAESASGWTSKVPFVGSKIVDAHDRREIALPMLAAEPLRGRATGVGVAGRRARVNAMGSATKQKNGMV